MTDKDFHAAVDAAVARWHQDRRGELLSCQAFADAQPAKCHDNAAAYVTQHGGTVVHGFLVQHPANWTLVWIMPHSVVWTGAELIDVTLAEDQLRGLGFFPIDGHVGEFVALAKQYPRESRPIASALLSRLEHTGS